MANSQISTTEGSGKNVATYSISETTTKEVQRVSLNDSSGVELTANIGSLTETAPTTDTASSGLNGRLQRIAQRVTSMIALLPTALGQGTMAQSLRVVLPSDQAAIPVTVSSANVTPIPAASGGPTLYRIMSAANTNAQLLNSGARQVYGWYFVNNSSTAKFVKFYNKASSPTVGSDTPYFTLTIPSPGSANGAGTNIEFSLGIPFSLGVALAITGAIADSDTTAVGLNDISGFILYK
jgi:hypothetical protein